MVDVDPMSGAVSLPLYIQGFIARVNSPVGTYSSIFSVVFLQASITFAASISGKKLYATYCRPLEYTVKANERHCNFLGVDSNSSKLCHTFGIKTFCFQDSLFFVLGAIHLYSNTHHMRL